VPSAAWLRRHAAGATTRSGDDADIERLEKLDTVIFASEPDPDGRVPPRCQVVGPAEGRALVYAEAGGDTLVMLIDTDKAGAVATAWRSVMR
jgi:hypothetical protein